MDEFERRCYLIPGRESIIAFTTSAAKYYLLQFCSKRAVCVSAKWKINVVLLSRSNKNPIFQREADTYTWVPLRKTAAVSLIVNLTDVTFRHWEVIRGPPTATLIRPLSADQCTEGSSLYDTGKPSSHGLINHHRREAWQQQSSNAESYAAFVINLTLKY